MGFDCAGVTISDSCVELVSISGAAPVCISDGVQTSVVESVARVVETSEQSESLQTLLRDLPSSNSA